MEVAIIPRFIIEKLYYSDVKQIHANVLFSNLLILILIFLHNYTDNIRLIPSKHHSQG